MLGQERAGTLTYMSPEQIEGKPRPASDQYALGVMVYEWLCGITPFQGTMGELLAQHCKTPPAPLRQHVPDLLAQWRGWRLAVLSEQLSHRALERGDAAKPLVDHHSQRILVAGRARLPLNLFRRHVGEGACPFLT